MAIVEAAPVRRGGCCFAGVFVVIGYVKGAVYVMCDNYAAARYRRRRGYLSATGWAAARALS